MLSRNFGGVFIEANTKSFIVAEQRFANRDNVKLINTMLRPDNVVDIIFPHLNNNMDIDLLKIDVDNGDCDFLRSLISAGLKPKLIHIEAVTPIPPPFIYRDHFSEDNFFEWNETMDSDDSNIPLIMKRGCSIAAILEDANDDYRILQVEFDDVLYALFTIIIIQ